MAPTLCDDRGRLLLPQKLREQYGRAYHIVDARGEIILMPAARDPVRDLAELGSQSPRLQRMSIAQIRQEARKQAAKDALLSWKR